MFIECSAFSHDLDALHSQRKDSTLLARVAGTGKTALVAKGKVLLRRGAPAWLAREELDALGIASSEPLLLASFCCAYVAS